MSKKPMVKANKGEGAVPFESDYQSFLALVPAKDRQRMADLVVDLDVTDPDIGSKLALMLVAFGLMGQVPPQMLKALKPYLDILSAQALGRAQTAIKGNDAASGLEALAASVAATKSKGVKLQPSYVVEQVEVVSVIRADEGEDGA